MQRNGRKNMAKLGMEIRILNFIKEASRPVSTREISQKLNVAWHTADRYCLKLQLKDKIDTFTIGKSTAWFIKISEDRKKTKDEAI